MGIAEALNNPRALRYDLNGRGEALDMLRSTEPPKHPFGRGLSRALSEPDASQDVSVPLALRSKAITAAFIWLKNRDPDRWRDVQNVEHVMG